jgi:histidinol-phosphate aminotransferase
MRANHTAISPSQISVEPRPELATIAPVTHGGFNSDLPAGALDFSANVNPFGPSPRVWAALSTVKLGQHPDPRAAPLRQFLAALDRVDPARVLIGNGSIELIYHLAVAYLRPGDRVLVVEPTFGEYAAAARVMGAQVLRWRTDPERLFALDLDGLLHLAAQARPRLLFLCNPNNPSGTYYEREVVTELLLRCPETLVVLDEAFVRFVEHTWQSRELSAPNLLVLRSLTKDYALTGLRVGYARAEPNVIAALEKVQPPWSVNALAQVAAVAAIQDEQHFRQSLASLAEAKEVFVRALSAIGLAPLPSRTHFFLLHAGMAAEWRRRLLERGLLVRDCASFGLPDYLRIAVRRPEENARLVAALAELKEELCPVES